MVTKKVIWYRGFQYEHPRKKGDQALIWKPIIVHVKAEEVKKND